MSGTNNIGNDHHYTNNVGGGGAGGSGPCGACRFLRRKCVNGGCIFAPYFGSDHLGTAHFAAVHKVFGASNASKILMRIPPHKRLDAVVSLCYEALSRVSDPVYGCVSQIFTLQQQVVNLQAELAYTQARLSILRHPLLPLPRPQTPSPADLQSSTELQASDSNMSVHFDPSSQLSEQRCFQVATLSCNCTEEELKDDDLRGLARELVAKYLPGIRIRPSD